MTSPSRKACAGDRKSCVIFDVMGTETSATFEMLLVKEEGVAYHPRISDPGLVDMNVLSCWLAQCREP